MEGIPPLSPESSPTSHEGDGDSRTAQQGRSPVDSTSVVPALTNTSIALAEFASLLQTTVPGRSKGYLREHIMHLLEQNNSEETLASVARVLEKEAVSGTSQPSVMMASGWDTETSYSSPVAAMQHHMSSPYTQTGSSPSSSPAGFPPSTRSVLLPGSKEVREEDLFAASRARSLAAGTPRVSFSVTEPSSTPVVRRRSFVGAAALGLPDMRSGAPSGEEDDNVGAGDDGDRESADCDGGESPSQSCPSSPTDTTVSDVTSGTPTQVMPNRARRDAVSSAPFMSMPSCAARHAPKKAEEQRRLRKFLRESRLFTGLAGDDLEEVVTALRREVYAANTYIMEQDMDAKDRLYLIAEGSCEAVKNGKTMGVMAPGGIFGELELMYKQAKCTVTIRCVTRCVLYTLNEENYRRAVMAVALQKRTKYEELIMKVPFLQGLLTYERAKLAEALVTKTYKTGEYVTKFGYRGTHMQFILEGEARVVGRQRGQSVEVMRLHEGDVIGELEFLFNQLTVADVIACSKRLVTASISRHHFEIIAGPIHHRLKDFVATSPAYEKHYHVVETTSASKTATANNNNINNNAAASVHSETASKESPTTRKEPFTASAGGATLSNVDRNGEIVVPTYSGLLATGGVVGRSFSVKRASNSSSCLRDTGDRQHEGYEQVSFRFPLIPLTDAKKIVAVGLRADGIILSWNSTLERLTNYPADEVLGQNIYSFMLVAHEQQVMTQAITEARRYAGNVQGFLSDPTIMRETRFTLARSDGLTRAAVTLTILPPFVASGASDSNNEMLLAYGEEVKQHPAQLLDQSQWLSSQLRSILADSDLTYEERLGLIAESVSTFDTTYRALTLSTERLRVVNLRQVIGQVLMDYASECVSRNLAVRQRFEALSTERVYVDAEKLPECLRYAMSTCMELGTNTTQLTITVTVAEKNGLEFLVINFNVDGPGFSDEYMELLQRPMKGHLESSTCTLKSAPHLTEEGKLTLSSQQRQHTMRVRVVVEEQGGTMLVEYSPGSSNMLFLIPFIPAGIEDPASTLMMPEAAAANMDNDISVSTSVLASASVPLPPVMDTTTPAPQFMGMGKTLPQLQQHTGLGPNTAGQHPPALMTPTPAPAYNFTTLVAEDTPAHRNMLCAYLWERKHAVLPAYTFADIERLAGVADILFIDLSQSIVSSLSNIDAIAWLRELSRHMAIVITSRTFEEVSAETFSAAGFVTLQKPCPPVQAFQAIHKAEDKIAAAKQEAERITMTRDMLAKNSRGAWKRGKLLGKGTFGEVFEAVDVLTGGKMAVKEMRLGTNNLRIEQFVDEISTMCNLQHRNIIHYFYCEQSDDMTVIRVFMEYAGGGTLQGLIGKKGPLPFTEFQRLLHDITEGLAYIHSQNYVHCDIKTANILLGNDGIGKIGDFGTARTVREGQLLYDMQGSPLYMSPECMSAGDIDEDSGMRTGYTFPSDIWSLGCVMLEMYTNKAPFSHIGPFNGPAGFTNFITSLMDTPDLSPLFGAPPSVVEFASACLNPDPARRATAQQLLQLSIFNEVADEATKSAVESLKRAQLLHVLNKFVAFQEPDVARKAQERAQKYKTRPRTDLFDSSTDSSRSGSKRGSTAAGGGITTLVPLYAEESEKRRPSAAAVAMPMDADSVDDDGWKPVKLNYERRRGLDATGGDGEWDSEAAFFASSTASTTTTDTASKAHPSFSRADTAVLRTEVPLLLTTGQSMETVGTIADSSRRSTPRAMGEPLLHADLPANLTTTTTTAAPSVSGTHMQPATTTYSLDAVRSLTSSSPSASTFPSRPALQNFSMRGANMEEVLRGAAAKFLSALHRRMDRSGDDDPSGEGEESAETHEKDDAAQEAGDDASPLKEKEPSSFVSPESACIKATPSQPFSSAETGDEEDDDGEEEDDSETATTATGSPRIDTASRAAKILSQKLQRARRAIAKRSFFRVEEHNVPAAQPACSFSSFARPGGALLHRSFTSYPNPEALLCHDSTSCYIAPQPSRAPRSPGSSPDLAMTHSQQVPSGYYSPMSYPRHPAGWTQHNDEDKRKNEEAMSISGDRPGRRHVVERIDLSLKDLTQQLQHWAASSGSHSLPRPSCDDGPASDQSTQQPTPNLAPSPTSLTKYKSAFESTSSAGGAPPPPPPLDDGHHHHPDLYQHILNRVSEVAQYVKQLQDDDGHGAHDSPVSGSHASKETTASPLSAHNNTNNSSVSAI